MEVETMRRMVKRWEDDQKVAIVVINQSTKMDNVRHASCWNVRYEYDADHAKSIADI
jgi:hypothetical protein